MAYKEFNIEGLGTVTIYKRRGSRSLRLSVQADGSIRVTIPTWAPFASGVNFAKSRAGWIAKHREPPRANLRSGQQIGKAHRLLFMRSLDTRKVTTRLRQTEIIINYPAAQESTEPAIQAAAQKAAVRALKAEAQKLLPIRLAELAAKHDFSYGEVTIKQLKTRWGSCDQDQNITLNLYLMQLPWPLIDYVLLHELTHTRIMQHGPTFWEAMRRVLPTVDSLRKEIKVHRSALKHETVIQG